MIMIIPSFTLGEWRPDRLAHMMPSQDPMLPLCLTITHACSGYYRKLIVVLSAYYFLCENNMQLWQSTMNHTHIATHLREWRVVFAGAASKTSSKSVCEDIITKHKGVPLRGSNLRYSICWANNKVEMIIAGVIKECIFKYTLYDEQLQEVNQSQPEPCWSCVLHEWALKRVGSQVHVAFTVVTTVSSILTTISHQQQPSCEVVVRLLRKAWNIFRHYLFSHQGRF